MARETELITQLRDVGIDAEGYARGPAGVRSFVASIDPHPKAGRLWIWEGRSKIDTATSKRARQGVLNVSEEGRELTTRLSVMVHERNGSGKAIGFMPEEEVIAKAVDQMRSRWSLPKGSHFEGKLRFMPKSLRSGSWAQVSVRAFAPASNTALLVGMDETHHFVAQLPSFGVSSVAAAHRMLKPAQARVAGSVRQGEWFFVPVRDKALAERLLRQVNMVKSESLEPRSTHRATVLHWNNKLYAIGSVVDSRIGRHAPLLLTEFHEVVRNREVVMVEPARREQRPVRRYWD